MHRNHIVSVAIMARSKDDITYGAAQAKLSEDESLRVAYKHGSPLEGGKIAESQPVHLFSAANRMTEADTSPPHDHPSQQQQQQQQQQRSGVEGDRQRPPKIYGDGEHTPRTSNDAMNLTWVG